MNASRALQRHRDAQPAAWDVPVALWCGVVAVALMSFYVYLLNTQVMRGEKLREAQRATAARPALQVGPVHQPGNAMAVLQNRPLRLATAAGIKQ